jgi:hypothetical protein
MENTRYHVNYSATAESIGISPSRVLVRSVRQPSPRRCLGPSAAHRPPLQNANAASRSHATHPIFPAIMAGPVRQPIDVASLAGYIASKIPEIALPLEIKQFGYGQSNPTYQLKASDGKKYVMRKKPPGKLLSKVRIACGLVGYSANCAADGA